MMGMVRLERLERLIVGLNAERGKMFLGLKSDES
jgi:hypothetical protein